MTLPRIAASVIDAVIDDSDRDTAGEMKFAILTRQPVCHSASPPFARALARVPAQVCEASND